MPHQASAEWPLWSTTARLVVTDLDALDLARGIAGRILDDVERAASRFRPDSELLNLNWDAHGAVRLSPTLAMLVERALEAARLTDGAVDPTVGAALETLGYDRDIQLIMRDEVPVRAVVGTESGWRRIHLDGQVLRMPSDLRLDLGATAKAVAADRCAEVIAGDLAVGVLVSLGGDIATAGVAPQAGWQVLVQDRPDDPATQVTLPTGIGMATSSTRSRVWRRGGELVHHIVDPATGRSAASQWRSVTVAAGSCFDANVATTATIALGDGGLEWLRRTGLPARLVDRGGNVLAISGWPEGEAAA